MPMSWTQIVEAAKGTRLDSWSQGAMASLLNLKEHEYSGMCTTLCAMFLLDPTKYLASRKFTSFKIKALQLFGTYKEQQNMHRTPADTFIKDSCLGFAWEHQVPKTPMSDGWPSKHMMVDGRYFLGITGDGGHALAVIVQKDSLRFTGLQKYLLLDPNDGVAGFDTWEGLHSTLGWHLHDSYPGHTHYYLTRWKL